MRTGLGLTCLVALLTTGVAAAAQARDPVPSGSPLRWFSAEDYPRVELEEGRGGSTQVRVTVSDVGLPTQCDIQTSSGSKRLDAASCRIVMERGRFEPARNASGKAVVGVWSDDISWRPDGEAVAGHLSRLGPEADPTSIDAYFQFQYETFINFEDGSYERRAPSYYCPEAEFRRRYPEECPRN